jgi:hypothetical protein
VTHWLKQETINWLPCALAKVSGNMTDKHTDILQLSEQIYFLNFFFSLYIAIRVQFIVTPASGKKGR